MHILLSLETGGCENGIVNLINNMDFDRFKVSVCCLETVGELSERIARERKHVYLLLKKGRPQFKDLLDLSRLLRRERVDIVHTHGWGTVAIGYLSAKLAGVSVVIHGEHGGVHMDSTKKILAQKMLYRLVDSTVTVSQDLQTRLASLFNVSRDLFCPIINGVDSAKFSAVNGPGQTALKEQYGIAPDCCVIGSVGRLVDWKRHDVLIQAVETLLLQGNDVSLLIVGDGPSRASLQVLINVKGISHRVFLVGRKENVADFLSAMDIFALTSSSSPSMHATGAGRLGASPTEFEGISNALLEAMACGLPVVATDVGGTPEIVSDGQTGYLFAPGDFGTLNDALATLVRDKELRTRMGNSARKSIEDRFSLMTMVHKYQELYLDIARKKSVIR